MKRPPCTPLVAVQFLSLNGRWLHVQVSCRRWGCKSCGPIKRYILQKNVLLAQKDHCLNFLWTLTLAFGVVSPEESPQFIQKSWNKLLTLVRRKYGKLKFILFKEFQKNGMAHLHVLVDKDVAKKWLSDRWSAVGGGWQIDVQPVEGDGTIKYLCKYLTKATPIKLPKLYRRVSASKGIVLFPSHPSKGKFKAFPIDYRVLANSMLSDRTGTIERNGEEVGFEASRPAVLRRVKNNHKRDFATSQMGRK